MKEKLRKAFRTGIIVAAIFSSYISGMNIINIATLTKSASLNNKQHAEQFIKKEQKNLRIEDRNIELIIEEGCKSAYAQKKQHNEYKIGINPEYLKEGTLKHEIYHIADGHCDTSYGPILERLKYLFYNEPKAMLYAAFDIKL